MFESEADQNYLFFFCYTLMGLKTYDTKKRKSGMLY